jgi:hypothetical protein
MIELPLTASQTLAQSTYAPYTFITFAGTAAYGSADGTGNTARFYQPFGAAVDSVGNVYVAVLFRPDFVARSLQIHCGICSSLTPRLAEKSLAANVIVFMFMTTKTAAHERRPNCRSLAP